MHLEIDRYMRGKENIRRSRYECSTAAATYYCTIVIQNNLQQTCAQERQNSIYNVYPILQMIIFLYIFLSLSLLDFVPLV